MSKDRARYRDRQVVGSVSSSPLAKGPELEAARRTDLDGDVATERQPERIEPRTKVRRGAGGGRPPRNNSQKTPIVFLVY